MIITTPNTFFRRSSMQSQHFYACFVNGANQRDWHGKFYVANVAWFTKKAHNSFSLPADWWESPENTGLLYSTVKISLSKPCVRLLFIQISYGGFQIIKKADRSLLIARGPGGSGGGRLKDSRCDHTLFSEGRKGNQSSLTEYKRGGGEGGAIENCQWAGSIRIVQSLRKNR